MHPQRRTVISAGLCFFAVALVFALPTIHWATASPSQEPLTFTYLEGGRWKSVPIETLLAWEESSAREGHQPWRWDPGFSASVDLRFLLPMVPEGESVKQSRTEQDGRAVTVLETSEWRAEFLVTATAPDARMVDVLIDGTRVASAELRRPFGLRWYTVGIPSVSPRLSKLLPRPAAAAPLYLADHPELLSLVQMGWGELGLNTCAHAPGQAALPLQIGDHHYPRGLGHHAPGALVVELGGRYRAFLAEVGVQRQQGATGSVVFRVLVDGRQRFDSGVMRERDRARPVLVPLVGAQELELVVTDAGDGITCDCANWAEARLLPQEGPVAPPPPPRDVAPCARVMTWDPDRADGTRAGRTQEFPAEDLFLGRELVPLASGGYPVPAYPGGRGCLGLQWRERRQLRRLELAAEGLPSDLAGIKLEYWTGESPWQGRWLPAAGELTREGGRLRLELSPAGNPGLQAGTQKVRWMLPAGTTVMALSAYTGSRWGPVRLRLEGERARGQAAVAVYNGELAGGGREVNWDVARPLSVAVRACQTGRSKADATVLHFRLPSGQRLAVAVADVLRHGAVYVPSAGLFVGREPGMTLAGYRRRLAGRQTVRARVARLPDQTWERALARTHHPVQDNGPTMLSLAADNSKFVVEREGQVRFGQLTVQPRFGAGSYQRVRRHLEGGWLPVVVTELEVAGLRGRQRSFVAPWPGPGAHPRGLFAAELELANPGRRPASARLTLAFQAGEGEPPALRVTEGTALLAQGDRLLALVEARDSGLLLAGQGTELILAGTLAPGKLVRCRLLLPGWSAGPAEQADLLAHPPTAAQVAAYWQGQLAPAVQIELPCRGLGDVIRASQVHCLMAARNQDDYRQIEPWIAAMAYGPLESEAHSVIRGMDLLGHHEFARRALDFFARRYHPDGYLTTGYTLMGTGWHLWTLGEHCRLAGDAAWLREVAPGVERVCRWIVRQRAKTRQLDPSGGMLPEWGLVPPGVMADWNAYAYYFCLNGYYCAGLREAAGALAEIGYPGAEELAAEAQAFASDIRRAYHQVQAQTPVLPLADGTWVSAYPSQLACPGPTNDFFPGQDGNRSWAYDVELGAHQLVPQGVLAAGSREVGWMLDHLEDVQFLAEGWFDYPAAASQRDWFDLGGFAKVQPYYCRNAEIYALRDEVKPFLRSYFGALATMLNTENLSLWEHFHNTGAFSKTHETGYFLAQTRFMLVSERGQELWLAPLVSDRWLQEGMTISVQGAPTAWGPMSYRIHSRVRRGWIEAEITPPTRGGPQAIVLRLRHPEGKRLAAVTVNGRRHADFDPARECIRLAPGPGRLQVRADYR